MAKPDLERIWINIKKIIENNYSYFYNLFNEILAILIKLTRKDLETLNIELYNILMSE